MKLSRSLSALAVAGVLTINACGDNGPSVLTVADLVGTWNGTSLSYVLKSNSAVSIELISLGGAFSITLQSNGSYTQNLTLPGAPAAAVETGTFTLTNATSNAATGTLTPTDGSAVQVFVFTLSTANSLSAVGDAGFPVPPAAGAPATLTIQLTRG